MRLRRTLLLIVEAVEGRTLPPALVAAVDRPALLEEAAGRLPAELIVAAGHFGEAFADAVRRGDAEAQRFFLCAFTNAVFPEPSRRVSFGDWKARREESLVGSSNDGRVDFYANYRRIKARSGLETLEQVAAAAGISKTTVVAVEQGRGRPHLRTLRKLAKAFHVGIEELLGDERAAATRDR